MQLAAQLEATLREFASSSAIEIRENSGRSIPFQGLSWEVRGAPEKPLLHLWSEQYNLTRRVLAITDRSEARLALAVERFGRGKPDRLEFVRLDFERPARVLSREEFCERLRRILSEQFPDETVTSLTTSSDLEHSLSGNYARGLLRRGSSEWGVLAVPDGESADTLEGSLTFALLWLERLRDSSRRSVTGLRLIIPKGAPRTVAHRIRALDPKLPLELYERDPNNETIHKIDARGAGNVDSWLVPYRETQMLLDRALPALDPLIAIAPRAISVHPDVAEREVWLRFRGLPMARWEDGRVFFGLGNAGRELTAVSHPKLVQLLKSLETHRSPLASDTRHPLYRSQPERWLEFLVSADVTRIDAALDPRFVYTQVLADTGGQVVYVLELSERGPAGIASPPFAARPKPDRERLREILVRMALGVPEAQVLHEMLAGGIRPIVARIMPRGRAEQLLPTPAALQLVGMLHGMARLVTENGHALGPGAALDLEHHFLLEFHQAGMGEIEGNRNAGHICRTEPLRFQDWRKAANSAYLLGWH